MKTWIKGGVVGAILAVLLFIADYLTSSHTKESLMIGLDIFMWALVIFVLLGIIIGWIISKIKSKKQIA